MAQNRQLAAIMFTDIVGYTSIMGKDEDKALSLLDANRKLQKPLIEKYNGRLLKELGDGTLAQFNSAYDAVKCAKEIQLAASAGLGSKLRIGIHLGDVTTEDGDVFGDGVNLASRIQGVADPGGIYVSDSIENAIRSRSDIITKKLGEAHLKNVDYPVKIFAIQGDGLPPPSFKSTRIRRREKNAITIACAIVILAIAAWLITKNIGSTKLAGIRSLVVLPLANLTGSAENDYLVDGIQDALSVELSQVGSLRVISTFSSRTYAKSNKSLSQIADELKVDAVIEGSVLRADDSIRLNVKLIKIIPQEDQLWAGAFDHGLGQLLMMVTKITREISARIKITLTPEEEELISKNEEVDPDLFKLYLRGKFHLDKYTREGFQKGIGYLNEALNKDPAYALAYAAMSIGYGDLAHLPSAPHEAFPRAKALVKRALELDAKLPAANTAMAEASLYHDWHIKTAEKHFRAALEIDSSFAPAVSNYGWYLDLIGKKKEAEYFLRKSVEIDPLAPIYGAWLAWWYWIEKRFEEGVTEAKKVLAYSPNFALAKYVLGGIYADMGKFDEAIKLSKEAADSLPTVMSGLGVAYVKAGKLNEAKALLDKMEKGPFHAFSFVLIYSEMGNYDEALKWLAVVRDIRHIFTPWITSGFFVPTFAKDPRVKQMLKPILDSIEAAKN